MANNELGKYEKYASQVYRIDGKDSFLEILNTDYSIGKVHINFCQYDSKSYKIKSKIEIYMDFPEVLALCKMITSDHLLRIMVGAAKEGTFEGNKVTDYTAYYSKFSGISVAPSSIRGKRIKEMFPQVKENNGKYVISKQFKIQRASQNNNFIVLRAEYANGKIEEKGIISPIEKSFAYVNIPMKENQAWGMAEMITISIQAYLQQYYAHFRDKLFKADRCIVWSPDNQQGSELKAGSVSAINNPVSSVGYLADSDLRKLTIQFISDFKTVQDGLVSARVKCTKKEFTMYFEEELLEKRKQEFADAMINKKPVTVLYITEILDDENLCYFMG